MIASYRVSKIYVDEGSSIDIMYEHYFNKLPEHIESRLRPPKTPLIGFSCERSYPEAGIAIVRSDYPSCDVSLTAAVEESKIQEITWEPIPGDTLKEHKVIINREYPYEPIMIGADLSPQVKNKLAHLLADILDVFAWKPSDMTRNPLPSSPAKPIGGGVMRTRSESFNLNPNNLNRSEAFHITHKVPVGDSPYVRAKNVQLVEKDPERAIPLFWAAINAGDRVDSALKDMAIVMKQQNRAEEAIEAIKSLRRRCSDQAQESLDNILLDLYKRCGRLDDQIGLLRHKLFLIQQGMAFNGKRTKTARSQGKKFQVSVEQEATRLLGNLGWALMQQNNYIEAEDAYRRALVIAPDNNKMCNLGICLMKQGRLCEAKDTLRLVKPAVVDGPRGVDSHLKAYERAQQMLRDLESEMMNSGGDPG
ncbi:pollenless 3-like protein 2 [Tanacetum coccineum]